MNSHTHKKITNIQKWIAAHLRFKLVKQSFLSHVYFLNILISFLQDNFGFDLQAVEAATKKHEAIETDIAAYEERVLAVVAVARELETENYHDIKRIAARKDNVLRLWEYLLELLKARRQRLEMNLGLQRVFQEMLYIMDWMDEMKVSEEDEDGGRSGSWSG